MEMIKVAVNGYDLIGEWVTDAAMFYPTRN